jgi:carbon storage regulator
MFCLAAYGKELSLEKRKLSMLVLARKSRESVVVGAADNLQEVVRVTVIEVRGGTVRLGFEAGNEVPIHRAEVWERIRAESQAPDPEPIAPRPKYRVPYID